MSQNSNDSSSNAKPNPWQNYTFDGEKTGTMPSVTRLLNRKSLKREVPNENANNEQNPSGPSLESKPDLPPLLNAFESLPPPPQNLSLNLDVMPPLPKPLDLNTGQSDIPPIPTLDIPPIRNTPPPPPPKSDGTQFTKMQIPPPPPNPTMAQGEFTRVAESAKKLSQGPLELSGKNSISSLGHRSFIVWNRESMSKSPYRVEKEFSKKAQDTNEVLVLLKWIESPTTGEKQLEPKCVFSRTEMLRFFDGFSLSEAVFSKFVRSYNPVFAAFQASDLTEEETSLFLAAFGLNTIQLDGSTKPIGRLISSTEQDGHIYVHVSSSTDRSWLDRALAPADAS